MYTKKTLLFILRMVIVAICIVLVIIGQRTVSYPSLGLMLVGVAGILAVLGQYNHSFNKGKE